MIEKKKDGIKSPSDTRLIVLGGGLVGGPLAMDLAREPGIDVTVADVKEEALAGFDSVPALRTLHRDLSEEAALAGLLKEFDFVVNALPGFLGFRALEEIVKAGKDVVDIAFYPENPLALHDLAVEKDVTAVVDCGVAPGMSNLLTGFADAELDRTDSVRIYVGGLPQVREWPFFYRAVFSVTDVLEEYIRPARFRRNGVFVSEPALSGSEYVDFEGIGTLEAFNTDGLRTLAETIDAPDMIEKTLRYPGHIEGIRMLREAGFFSKKVLDVGGMRVSPFDVAAAVLSRTWKMGDADRDLTVMRILIEGAKGGRRLMYSFEMVDRFDEPTGIHSMARTTGYSATAAVRLVLSGRFTRKGISPPEFIGRQPGCVDFMLGELERRGIKFSQKIEEMEPPDSE
jgi:lysine 6-dehydrogenase